MGPVLSTPIFSSKLVKTCLFDCVRIGHRNMSNPKKNAKYDKSVVSGLEIGYLHNKSKIFLCSSPFCGPISTLEVCIGFSTSHHQYVPI
jgi:hypothetical protein